MKKRTAAVLSLLTAGTLLTGGCAAKGGGPDGVIDYWLWDATQQPGYQACADAFEEANPGLKVRITQYGWDDYWGKLTAGFIADQAPDVFTNHLTKYAQFIDLEVLVPLDDLEATRDVKDSDYVGGLAGLWKGRDGKRYGIPKDWDTIAYFYDQKVTDAAGVTREQLMNMNWNPDDGGSFEKIIAHLSVDANGVRGDEPGFDRNNVVVYGLASEGPGVRISGRPSGVPTPAPSAGNPSTRTPGAHTSTWTTPASRRPWPGTSAWWRRATCPPTKPSANSRVPTSRWPRAKPCSA